MLTNPNKGPLQTPLLDSKKDKTKSKQRQHIKPYDTETAQQNDILLQRLASQMDELTKVQETNLTNRL